MLYNTHPHRQSYDIEISVQLQGTDIKQTSSYDLKNPSFRYMAVPSMVTGTQHASPTEAYFDSLNPQNTAQNSGGTSSATAQHIFGRTDTSNLVNGGPVYQASQDPNLSYQQIPIPIQSHVIPMSQAYASSGSHVLASPNQLMYAVTSASPGGGLVHKYQQLHSVSQVTSGVYHTPFSMGNFNMQQGTYSHSWTQRNIYLLTLSQF